MTKKTAKDTKYDRLITELFRRQWNSASTELPFSKNDVIAVAESLGLQIKNLADVIYTYRSRKEMPAAVREAGNWVIA